MKQLDAESFLEQVSTKAAALRRPEGVTFELTYGCNLRCVHCYNPTHKALPHELTTREVCTLLNQIADVGVLTVTFTGGEPSVRPDIGEILHHARRQGLMTHLMTNATRMTSSFTTLLGEVAISQVNVSIYGATEAVYERMTAVPGSYRQFRRGLLNLADAELPVLVRMPVTAINSEEIQACRQLVESLLYEVPILPGDHDHHHRRSDPVTISPHPQGKSPNRSGIAPYAGAPLGKGVMFGQPVIHRMRVRPEPVCHYSLWRDEPLHCLPYPPLCPPQRHGERRMGSPQADRRPSAPHRPARMSDLWGASSLPPRSK